MSTETIRKNRIQRLCLKHNILTNLCVGEVKLYRVEPLNAYKTRSGTKMTSYQIRENSRKNSRLSSHAINSSATRLWIQSTNISSGQYIKNSISHDTIMWHSKISGFEVFLGWKPRTSEICALFYYISISGEFWNFYIFPLKRNSRNGEVGNWRPKRIRNHLPDQNNPYIWGFMHCT